jgi:(p)ppGpp synthase/HD superfamily hydrolase
MLDLAIEIACSAHKGQKDKAGDNYILHPLRLMLKFEREEERVCAVLHDVIEDSNMTIASLTEKGFSLKVLDALECLTKRNNEPYEDFIQRISGNNLASRIKIEDIKDNLNLSRLQELKEYDLKRIDRYHKALSVKTTRESL